MFSATKRLALGGLLTAGVVMATGCKKGPSYPPIDESAIVGSWVEVVEKASSNPRVRARPQTTDLRCVTLNADKTFEFSLRTKSGEPAKFKSEGTWAIEDNMLVFKVTSNTFPKNDERRDWAPESSTGIRDKDISGEGLIEVLPIGDLQDMVVDYKRAP